MELFTRDRGGPSRKEVEGGGIVYELNGFSTDSLERLVEYAYTSMYVLFMHILPTECHYVCIVKFYKTLEESGKCLSSECCEV